MQKETSASKCVSTIKELLLTGNIPAGSKIKGDYLKMKLDCGLSPIREALSRLTSTGVVEVVDNIGFRVAKLDKVAILDFYRTYAKIEQILFIESIKNCFEYWEKNVVSALYQLAKIETSNIKIEYSKWSKCNDEFHRSLTSGANLTELMQYYKSLEFKKLWYHNCIYGVENNKLITVNHREHNKIAQLALDGDETTASSLLYKHTIDSGDILITKLT